MEILTYKLGDPLRITVIRRYRDYVVIKGILAKEKYLRMEWHNPTVFDAETVGTFSITCVDYDALGKVFTLLELI